MNPAPTPSIDLPEACDLTAQEIPATPRIAVDHFHILPYHRTANIRTLRKAQRRAGQGAAIAGICQHP